MVEQILNNLNLIEYKVNFSMISDFERMEERFFDIEKNFGDIVGMNVNAVEFCPNNKPPVKDEILAWLWIIHPELKDEIFKYADKTLKIMIQEYEEYGQQ